MSNNKWWNY